MQQSASAPLADQRRGLQRRPSLCCFLRSSRPRHRRRLACDEDLASPVHVPPRPSASLACPGHPRREVAEGGALRRGTLPGYRYRAPQTPCSLRVPATACGQTAPAAEESGARKFCGSRASLPVGGGERWRRQLTAMAAKRCRLSLLRGRSRLSAPGGGYPRGRAGCRLQGTGGWLAARLGQLPWHPALE